LLKCHFDHLQQKLVLMVKRVVEFHWWGTRREILGTGTHRRAFGYFYPRHFSDGHSHTGFPGGPDILYSLNVRNDEVLIRVKEKLNMRHEISKRKANYTGHILRRNFLLQKVTKGKIKGGDRSDRKTRKKT
jgi:hypothetical protein